MRVGGQTYRVVASDDDPQVQHLADLVDRKFEEVVPRGVGRSMTAHQAMFLTAMALAAEVEELRDRADRLEEERDRSARLAERAKDVVGRLLERVDSALASVKSPAPAVARDAPSSPGPRAETPSSPELPAHLDAEPIERPAARREEPEPDVADDYLQSLPEDVRPSPPKKRGSPAPLRPAVASSLPIEQDNDATVPRAPRAGLRLVRRSTSPDDDLR